MVSFFSEEKMTIVNLDLPILSQKQQEEEDQEQKRDQEHNQDEHWLTTVSNDDHHSEYAISRTNYFTSTSSPMRYGLDDNWSNWPK